MPDRTTSSSSWKNRAQAWSNADLDEFERQITEPRAHALTMMDGQAILRLIQRLREAEWGWKASATSVFELDRLLSDANTRIAQLERVREAANRLAGFLTLEGVLDDHDAFDLLLELEAELGTIGALNKEVARSNG